MALRKIVLPLDTKYTKHFKIDNYGFFINSIPPGLEAYIISNNEPNTQIVLETQTTIPSNTIIKEFTFTNVNPLPGKVLTLYYAESIKDFDYMPQTSIAVLEGSLEQTNQILNEIRDNLNNNVLPIHDKLDILDNHILPIDSKIATTNTKLDKLTDLETKLTAMDTKLDTLDSIDFAKDTTLSSVDTKLDTLSALDLKLATLTTIETKLDNLTTKLDTLNTKIETLNTNILDTNTKLDTLHNDNLTSIEKLEISNTYLYDIKNNTVQPY